MKVAWLNFYRNPKFSQVLNEWYAAHVIDIADSTAYGYKISMRHYIDYFGDIKIKSMNPQLIQSYILYLKNEKNLANKTINNKMKALSLCLRFAIKAGYLKRNPLDEVKIPSGKVKPEKKPFTENEMKKLLSQDFLPWIKDAVVIAYHTGMRPGEIYGLEWSDINFEQSFIMVQRSLSRACKVILKATKTECGIRRIDIDSYLVAYLEVMKSRSNSKYVFSATDNTSSYKIPWNLSARFREMCTQAGVVPRDFYTLRHTHATMLLSYGVHPKVVQERMGHSDVKITMGTYSYVTPTIQKNATNIFEMKKVPVIDIISQKKCELMIVA